ncbi:MAG: ubiquitin-like domain-containing protein [Kouleothrix sp.]|jgi:hypothetical protein|nr:ubiquitin-like domain-containing protein [Kouleothrix sp.]
MSKESGAAAPELGIETIKPREPVIRQLTEVYRRFNDYHIQLFSAEAPAFDSRIRASLFVKQLYAIIRFEIGALEVDEQSMIETTADTVKQMFDDEVKGDDEISPPLELGYVIGEAQRQHALVARQIEIQRESGIGEFVRGAHADEIGLETYNTIIGLVGQVLDTQNVYDVSPTSK